MLVLLLTIIKAALIALLCFFVFNIEILFAILIGIGAGIVLEALFLLIGITIAVHIGPRRVFTKKWANMVCGLILLCTNIKRKCVGLENIPEGPCVFYPNHKSLIDFFAVYKSTKEVVTFVAKKELLEGWFVKRYHGVIDCIFIDRENDRAAAESLLGAIKTVKEGNKLCIFPEGARTDRTTNNMQEGRAGAYKIAQKAKAPIVPVSLKNNHLIAKRSPWRRTKVEVVFHEPILYEEYKDMNTHEIEEKVRSIINSSFEE